MVEPLLRSARLNRSAAMEAGGHDFLMRAATDDLIERLSAVKRTFGDALAVFGRTAYLAEALQDSGQTERVSRLEESGDGDLQAAATDDLGLTPHSYDLVLAPLSLHHANDLPGALIQLRRALRPDGLLLASLPGPDTLRELREALLAAESELSHGAGQRIDPFADLQSLGALLQRAGFALPVADRDRLTVRYGAPDGLIRDLRGMGATRQTGADMPPLTRDIWARAKEIYRERFADADGRLRATFDIISLQGWVPHESQQKPLKPGSAKVSLTEVLEKRD